MSNPLKVLVVEDEMIIGAKISLFLTESGYEVIGILPRAEDALALLEKSQPDIALLDIQLKGEMDGIELAKVFHSKYDIPVIFLTANTDDATFKRSTEAKPFAFLAKPFNRRDLERALSLTINLMEDRTTVKTSSSKQDETTPQLLEDRIFIYHKDKRIRIFYSDIFYVKAERNYCRIQTVDKDYLLAMPMKNLEEKLPIRLFQRIHRSHIINITHVNEISDSVVKVGNDNLALSMSYKEDFHRRIKSV